MKKFFLLGLIIFLFGVWVLAFSFWKTTQPSEMNSFLPSWFSFVLAPSPSSTPKATPVLSPTSNVSVLPIKLYYDFTCPHCANFADKTLIPFLEKNKNMFSVQIFPYSKTTASNAQNEALLLFCLTKSTLSSIDILKATPAIASDWKKWRDSQPNADVLKTCMNDPQVQNALLKNREEAKQQGIRGTPTIIIDGKKFEGFLDPQAFATVISSVR